MMTMMMIVVSPGHLGQVTVLVNGAHHPRHCLALTAQCRVVRYQHVDADPVGVESVEEVLDSVVDTLGEVASRVELHDSSGHERHSVQVPPPDDTESFTEVLQTPSTTLIFKL